MNKLLFRLVVPLLLVGQAAAWRWHQLPKLPCPPSPSFTRPRAPGAMRHHRPCPRSCSQALAASSGQGEGDSSTSLGEDGGAVKPPRNDVHDAIMNRVMEYTQKETRWIEERMERKWGRTRGGLRPS